jgi:hypothetical protein
MPRPCTSTPHSKRIYSCLYKHREPLFRGTRARVLTPPPPPPPHRARPTHARSGRPTAYGTAPPLPARLPHARLPNPPQPPSPLLPRRCPTPTAPLRRRPMHVFDNPPPPPHARFGQPAASATRMFSPPRGHAAPATAAEPPRQVDRQNRPATPALVAPLRQPHARCGHPAAAPPRSPHPDAPRSARPGEPAPAAPSGSWPSRRRRPAAQPALAPSAAPPMPARPPCRRWRPLCAGKRQRTKEYRVSLSSQQLSGPRGLPGRTPGIALHRPRRPRHSRPPSSGTLADWQ